MVYRVTGGCSFDIPLGGSVVGFYVGHQKHICLNSGLAYNLETCLELCSDIKAHLVYLIQRISPAASVPRHSPHDLYV